MLLERVDGRCVCPDRSIIEPTQREVAHVAVEDRVDLAPRQRKTSKGMEL